MLIGNVDDLQDVLEDLRAAGTDHQWVEAKRAQHGVPTGLWRVLSAFANSEDGGLVLLGIDEQGGRFEIAGVREQRRVLEGFQDMCSRMEPALRPAISRIDHPEGTVIAAFIAPVDTTRRPCHYPLQGDEYETSYVRVGDQVQRLTRMEVAGMLAAQRSTDATRDPAPEAVELDPVRLAEFLSVVRSGHGPPADDRTILTRWGVIGPDGWATSAGALALGAAPQTHLPAARVACLGTPRRSDPAGTRQRATHVEGTVGELVDGTLAWLGRQLDMVQVVRDGSVFDEFDVPSEALREVVANALLHRSLLSSLRDQPIQVRVTERLVSVVSPGGLPVGVDSRQLGLDAVSVARNYALVHICEQLTTPSGARIVESQASGIPRADLACSQARTVPILYVIGVARVTALLVRGAVDIAAARQVVGAPDKLNTAEARLLAIMVRLAELRAEDPASALSRVSMTTSLAARVNAPSRLEDAAVVLAGLAARGLVEAHERPSGPVWELPTASLRPPPTEIAEDVTAPSVPGPKLPGVSKRRQQTVAALLRQIADSPDGTISASEADLGIGLRATRSAFAVALEAGLIESTTASEHDPTRAYRLTSKGRRYV